MLILNFIGKHKGKTITILKRIKKESGMDDNMYKGMYQTGASSSKFYNLPKIHKKDIPLLPIILTRDSITYGVAQELAGILQAMVGNTPHHIQNTQNFVESRKEITLHPGEYITSYDDSTSFTSVAVKPVLHIIKNRLQQDHTLSQRTKLTAQHIIKLPPQHLYPVPR